MVQRSPPVSVGRGTFGLINYLSSCVATIIAVEPAQSEAKGFARYVSIDRIVLIVP